MARAGWSAVDARANTLSSWWRTRPRRFTRARTSSKTAEHVLFGSRGNLDLIERESGDCSTWLRNAWCFQNSLDRFVVRAVPGRWETERQEPRRAASRSRLGRTGLRR